MLSKEQRAEMSRQNGAKSHGPVTDAGKAKSRMNALKHGEYAEKLAHYTPSHPACLANEDRNEFVKLVDEFLTIYKPANPEAFSIVRDMATARWQIERLQHNITITWNQAYINAGQQPNPLLPELHEMHIMGLAVTDMLSGNNILSKLNREVARLQRSLAQLEKRILFVNKNFPVAAPEPEITENEELPPQEAENSEGKEPPIYVTENLPHLIAACRRDYPNRKIVIVQPEASDYDYDEMPRAPRKAA